MNLDIIVHRVYFFFESGIIFYVFVINTIYFFLTAIGFFAMRKHHQPFNPVEQSVLQESPLMPAVSLIVPAYNEAMSVEESLTGMLGLRYPAYEVILVNDGSKDATLPILIDKFRLYRSARATEGPLTTKPIRQVYESRIARSHPPGGNRQREWREGRFHQRRSQPGAICAGDGGGLRLVD